MQDLNQIIFKAVMENDPKFQEIAEQQLIALRNQNPEAFLYDCAIITQNQKQNQFVRQSAGTLLGRTVNLKINNDTIFWDCVNNDVKLQIKNILLSTLGSPSQKSKRAAASAISIIASIQIFRGEWLDLIPLLVQNTNYPDEVIKRTSIMCIGFICEQLKQIGKNLDFNLSSSMLAGILHGLKKQQKIDMRISSFTALRDSMAFLGNVTQQKKFRDHTLSLVLQALSEQQLCQIALQTLIEFSKYNYDCLSEYVNPFFSYTQNIIRQHANRKCILAIELWNQIGAQYLERKKGVKRVQNKNYNQNHLLIVQQSLLPHLLSCLIVIDNDENIVREAANRALCTVAQCCGQIVFNVITNFISNTINNQDWTIKQASVLAFSTLCEVDQSEKVAELLERGLEAFMNLLYGQHPFVIESTLVALNKIFQFFPKVFLMNINYTKNINIFIECLSGSSKQLYLTVKTLNAITDGLKQSPECILANNVFNLLDTLTKLVFFMNQPQVINTIMSCILNLLQVNKDATLALKYVQHMVTRFKEIPEFNDKNNALRTGILTVINSAVLTMNNSSPHNQFFSSLYYFVINYFTDIKDVDSDGLYVISSIAIVWKKGFKTVMSKFWDYLKVGLGKSNQPTTFKSSLNLLSDIARSLQDQFNPWFQQVIQQLIFLITQNHIDRYSKIQVFICIGDCTLAVREKASKYLSKILDITDLAFDAAINFSKSSNSDDFDYSQILRDSIIDMYSCLNYAFNDIKKPNQLLMDHFKKLLQFVMMTCNRELNPTVQYIKNCVFLIIDSTYFYNAVNLLHNCQFINVVNLLKQVNSNNKQIREAVFYAERCIKGQ